MKHELQVQLFTKYPKLFRAPLARLGDSKDVREDWEQPAGTVAIDVRGVECGDGWFAIIDRLSAACELEIAIAADAGQEEKKWLRVVQVKEKFGSLRFCMRGALSGELRQQIDDAQGDESESFRTCERCGAPGRVRARGLRPPRCDGCEPGFLV